MSAINKIAKARSLGRQGDPGLFDFLGKAIKGVASAWLPNVFGSGSKVGPSVSPFPAIGAGQGAMKGIGTLMKHTSVRPGMLPGLPGGGIGFAQDLGFGQGSRAGLKKDGTPRRIKANGMPWKRPSMNFANGRAIKRASRRLEGAEKMFKKVFTIRHGGHAPAVHLKSRKGR